MLIFVILACGKATPDEAIADWVEEQGLSFRDCGALEFDQCTGEAIEPTDQTLINCITGAWASCEAASLEVSEPTIEGDPILTTYFVVPTDEGCELTRFIDSTQDAFGDGLLHQYTCTDLTELGECPGLSAEGCVEEE